MTEFPSDIKFKYSWRKYQQRVLDDLQDHLTDSHLHVIAPPGSGKTVLGLEVAIRLNKPTLILAPTIAIRNQWIQRLCELFLQTNLTPDWVSRDIRQPKFLTVVTYQGVHAACNGMHNEEDIPDHDEADPDVKGRRVSNSNLDNIVRGLKAQKVATIVVDEAHHLKSEWWQTLTRVKEKLNPIIVGLTATPPYDVTPTEWQRYIDLNGPVDTEISVPELVIEGDLCPHQDYVHFTLPTQKEYKGIIEFRENIEKLFQEIRGDEVIIQAIRLHPIWIDPAGQLEWIYNNLAYYSACLIFLNANQIQIPDYHLEVIGDKQLKVPQLNYEWMEVLLDFYLYTERVHFNAFDEHRKALENKLRRYGAVEKRKINFSHNRRVTGFLTSSISKLNAIKTIVDFERSNLDKDLRLVILSDFIRKEFYVDTLENDLELNKIGVIPIFEKLRRENKENLKIAVLTGAMIILPVSAYPAFEVRAAKYGINEIDTQTVPFDNDYVLINQTEQLKYEIVHIVTQIFQVGDIEVLIGTKSLLGEGWDAPAINALILASFVGSFVLSNQMRGRAIRTQKENPGKTGNIWHLVCIDPTMPTGGDDFDLLRRRFRSFVGVSFREVPEIENGVGRLNLPENIYLQEEAEKKNQEMFVNARDREGLIRRWKEALQTGVTLVEEIKIPFREKRDYKAVRSMYLYKTIGNLIATLVSGLVGFGLDSLLNLGRAIEKIETTRDLLLYLAMLGTAGMLAFGRLTYKTLRLFLKYRDISKDIQQIGDALLNALIKARLIRTERSKLKVETSVDDWGGVYCHLAGGSTFDKSVFINALQEVVGPVDNPRYVIVRKNRFMVFIEQRDYHSVPEALGRNKNMAEYFQSQWERLIGACDLIFTRTIGGRKWLLKSRLKSLSAQLEDKVERVSKWK